MDYWKFTLGLVVAASLGAYGCGGGDGDSKPLVTGTTVLAGADGVLGTDDDVTVENPEGTRTYVLGYLNIGQAAPDGDPNIVPGFNLDNRISNEDDPDGCFHLDFTSPPPDNETGVDNQLGPILASVGSSLDIEGTIAENIADGSLLILITVSEINDFTNDGDVHVALELGTMEGTGATMPTVDTMGNLTAGQKFNVNRASEGLVELSGQIVAGRLRAGPVDIILSLPIMGASLMLNIRSAQMRFNIAEAEVDTGVIGGELNVDETVNAIVMVAPEDIPESLARSILEGQADLQPDEMGDCQAVSVGLVFEGVGAERGESVTVP
jgi:hypothetical protein